MMLLDPRTPVIVGTIAIFGIGSLLLLHAPMPGGLSAAHARVSELAGESGCASCHHPEGMSAGCLECHSEIGAQLDGDTGFHAHLARDGKSRCQSCHAEHAGRSHALVNETSWGAQVASAFRHPHLDDPLVGAHESIPCGDCHEDHAPPPFTLPGFGGLAREASFLGLERTCSRCHDDVHAGGLTFACESCHGQDSFQPATEFDHDQHFPLSGGHSDRDCAECHVIPHPLTAPRPAPFPFDATRGTTCGECHKTPHFTSLGGRCESCHLVDEPQWSSAIRRVTHEKHAFTGFALGGPHAAVSCEDCHPRDLAFSERYQDPASPSYARRQDTCQGCHEDVHRGQFRDQHAGCLDCHRSDSFRPSVLTVETHARTWELLGAHGGVACVSCHERDETLQARRFVGTSHECKGCHTSPHGEQFVDQIATGDCTQCHPSHAESFEIPEFQHLERTGFALLGAHASAACGDCHAELPDLFSDGRVRRFVGTPRNCSSCHVDVHRGQFRDYGVDACSVCHQSAESWKEITFDHDLQSRFSLTGSHAGVSCERCHQPVALKDGGSLIHYKPLGRECRDCHAIPR